MTTTHQPLHPTTASDMLALADTKLVLGNWFAECVINGRSLPDFAAMLGMCSSSYGHARALYQLLAARGDNYARLERGRGPEEIHSMEMLDRAPQSWEDFLCSIWLAELATWTMASGFLKHPDRTLAGIARKMGEESYFHLKYVTGWLQVLTQDEERAALFLRSAATRRSSALLWFGLPGEPDVVFDAGERNVALATLRDSFMTESDKTLTIVSPTPLPSDAPTFGPEWRRAARRHGALPQRLYEVIRFKDAELAH